MTKTRRNYREEFKIEAVRLYERSAKTQEDVEKELGIGSGCLSGWKKKYGVDADVDELQEQAAQAQRLRKLEREAVVCLINCPPNRGKLGASHKRYSVLCARPTIITAPIINSPRLNHNMGKVRVVPPASGSNVAGVDVGVGGAGSTPALESSAGEGDGTGVTVASGGTGGRVAVGCAWGAGAASTENRPTPRLPHSINRPKNPSNNTLAPALIAHSLPGCGAAAGSA
jgi:transposase-like protein